MHDGGRNNALVCSRMLFAAAGKAVLGLRSKTLLVADINPLAQVRVPLPAGSGASGAAQAGNAYPRPAASAATAAASARMTPAAAPVTNAPTDANAAAAAANVSTADVSSAAADVSTAAAASMSATAATGMSATAAVTAAASTCNSYAMAKPRLVFPVENVEGRQADVRDFLFAQKNPPCVVRRRYIRRCACRCTAACHGERNARRSQGQGCLSNVPFGTPLRLRHQIVSPGSVARAGLLSRIESRGHQPRTS